MDDGKNEASKVLTTNDIRERARNWTLAGDVGLLAHLEQFSENLYNKTQETKKHFDELLDDYDELHTKVGNVTNQFLALQNCQFVENRVYDEETPSEEKAEVKVQSEMEQEKLLLMQYKEAVEVGIKILDTHFEEVQLPPNSDSEDEDGGERKGGGDDMEVSAGNSVIWNPKNPYADKKFPLLIGSAEWWADDHVGLGTEEGFLDTEKVVSESDSDMESLKSVDKGMKSSSSSTDHIKSIPTKPTFLDSSSEDLFGLDKNENSASDDFFLRRDSLPEQPDHFLPHSEKEPETDTRKRTESSSPAEVQPEEPSPAGRSKKVDNAFTRELLAKLTSVTHKKQVIVADEKKEAEGGSPPAEARPDHSLFDETDDSSDLFSARTKTTAEAAVEKKGLFFDGENEDALFQGGSDLFSGRVLESGGVRKAEGRSVHGDILAAPKELELPSETESVAPKKTVMKDLFDDLVDDDALFAAAADSESSKSGYKSSLPPEENGDLKNPSAGVAGASVWDNDAGLFDGINTEGEDDFFSSSGLFDSNKTTDPKTSAESSSKRTHLDLFPEEPREKSKPESDLQDPDKNPSSVFDSFEVDFKKPAEDPFGFSPSKEPSGKKTSVLDSEDDNADDDLFSTGAREKKPAVLVSAFPDEDEGAALFVEKPKPPDSVSVSSSRSSLFDDMSASKSRLASVFEKDKNSSKGEDDLFSVADDSLFGSDAKAEKDLFSGKVKEREKSSLFDDCDDGDDLFGGGKVSGSEKPLLVEAREETPGKAKKQARPKAFIDDLEDEDLFKTAPITTTLRETKSEIFTQSESRLFADDSDDAELFSAKPAATKPKPPDSLSLKATESETKGKTVGKLNIPDNLKLRFESAAKHIASGSVRPPEKEKNEEAKDEVLDEPPPSSNLLKCPSKDRVKIPARRRPQSRRARQEAIRNSGVWDRPTSPVSTTLDTPHPSRDSLPSPAVSNPLSPSTDEEDFFKVPELDTNFEKEDQSIFKSDLFESSANSKPEESLLFDGAPVLSFARSRRPEEPAKKPDADVTLPSGKPKTTSLFDDDADDDDDDDDDFNGDGNDRDNLFEAAKPLGGQSSGRSEEKVKKCLFEEDSDGDDDELFGGGSEAVPPKAPPVEKLKEEGEGQGKGRSTFVDPLGLITKD